MVQPAKGDASLRKRTADKEICPSLSQKRRKTVHMAELSVFEKLQMFYGFLQNELQWSCGELLYYTLPRDI